ncbi:MAG: DUF92 domain-containing protein [Candidatus Diapherotrites archaeon]|nr:DUF92 domain-containing protein [Candidatus Diapherotrites archaeon]
MVFPLSEWGAVALIIVILSLLSRFKHLLDTKGIVSAWIVGLLVYFLGGFSSFIVLVWVYVVMELSTRYARKISGKPHETRTLGNILGNTGPAVIALAWSPSPLSVGFFGGLTAAMADTLSTEIGGLSKKKPVLITTLKEVEHGTDGGITLQGLLASLGGGLLIGFVYYTLNGRAEFIAVFGIIGLFGSLVDSVLGAVFERKGLLNNTQVNFLASSAGALIAWFLTWYRGL